MTTSKLFDLSGRVAVVVGGSSGIGRTLALGLADAGADVVATARRAELVDAVAGEIEARGRKTLRVTSDVADVASLEEVQRRCAATFGRVDIMLCAAGVTKRVATLTMEETDWNRIIETNITGTLRACRVFGRDMVARRSGRIINIASLTSFVGMYKVAAYTTSKAAVAGLTRVPDPCRLRRAPAYSSQSAPSSCSGCCRAARARRCRRADAPHHARQRRRVRWPTVPCRCDRAR